MIHDPWPRCVSRSQPWREVSRRSDHPLPFFPTLLLKRQITRHTLLSPSSPVPRVPTPRQSVDLYASLWRDPSLRPSTLSPPRRLLEFQHVYRPESCRLRPRRPRCRPHTTELQEYVNGLLLLRPKWNFTVQYFPTLFTVRPRSCLPLSSPY